MRRSSRKVQEEEEPAARYAAGQTPEIERRRENNMREIKVVFRNLFGGGTEFVGE